jgi:hypothetical protein
MHMKSGLLLLAAALSLASALSVNGQERAAEPGSFEMQRPRSIQGVLAHERTLEAIRRAAATGGSTNAGVDAPPAGVPSDWSRVRHLAPGTELSITLETTGVAAAGLRRYFVSADDATLTFLDLSQPNLSVAAARALRDVAARHPGYLDGAANGGTFVLGKLRLATAGVFLADRKVADLQEVVQTRARSEVVEIAIRQRGRGVWGHLGPLGGYFAGFMAGGFVAGTACRAVEGRDRCDTGPFLKGGVVGSLAGMAYGLHAARQETEKMIFLQWRRASVLFYGSVNATSDPG